MKQRPLATDLSGANASVDSLTARRINLAPEDARDFKSNLSSSVVLLPTTGLGDPVFVLVSPSKTDRRPPGVEGRSK